MNGHVTWEGPNHEPLAKALYCANTNPRSERLALGFAGSTVGTQVLHIWRPLPDLCVVRYLPNLRDSKENQVIGHVALSRTPKKI